MCTIWEQPSVYVLTNVYAASRPGISFNETVPGRQLSRNQAVYFATTGLFTLRTLMLSCLYHGVWKGMSSRLYSLLLFSLNINQRRGLSKSQSPNDRCVDYSWHCPLPCQDTGTNGRQWTSSPPTGTRAALDRHFCSLRSSLFRRHDR